MRKFRLITLLVLLTLTFQIVTAQDLEGNLKDIVKNQAKEYVIGYVQPLSTALGTSLGSALYHRGYAKGFPRFDVGVSTALVQIPDEAKTFKSVLGEVPTFFGSETNVSGAVSGIDQDYFILPMLQANVGLFASLEATARLVKWSVDDVGDITLYGGGLKYELSDLIPIPMFPVDFGVQALYHKFTIGEFLNAGTFSMNIQASGSIPVLPIDIYGGVGFDNSTLTVDSEKLVDTSQLGEVKVEGENTMRFNLGVSLTLLFFNIHADYNIGKYNTLGGGVMVVF